MKPRHSSHPIRLLIVEDQPDQAEEMATHLGRSFPHLDIQMAFTQSAAVKLLDTANVGRPYDLAILDFKLSESKGSPPETNQLIFTALRRQNPAALVVHTTAYPHDPDVTRLILEEATNYPFEPKSIFLSKTDISWPSQLRRAVGEAIARQESPRRSPRKKPAKFLSCFISYSHVDEPFVKRLFSRLSRAGLRVWYAAEHMQPGRKIHEEIEENIRLYDKLLLVLSPSSMRSMWVSTEIRTALAEEKKTGRRKLFPIRLVDFEAVRDWSSFNADIGKDMATELREYFIPDFSDWTDSVRFEEQTIKLLAGLRS